MKNIKKLFSKEKESKDDSETSSISSFSYKAVEQKQTESDTNDRLISINNWTDIHPNFSKQYERKTLQQHWKQLGLTYHDAQEWIAAGFKPNNYIEVCQWISNFTPQEVKSWLDIGLKIDDYEFVYYLRKDGYQLKELRIKTEQLRKKCSWQDIHKDFSFEKRKEWEKENLTHQDAKEWISIGFKLSNHEEVKQWKDHNFIFQDARLWIKSGAKIDDYKFISWLKNTKKEIPKWIEDYEEDYQVLSERFKKYGLCSECNQLNTGEQWCQSCNKSRLETMALPASNNPKINEFIQQYQFQATDKDKFIEWIPYERFTDIEFLAKGGFGKVYKAKWKEGNISYWNVEKKQWKREKQEVVLKSLANSSENTDFLTETEKHKIIDDWFNNIVLCYGLSQDPKTGNYLMVMQYMPEGNLRHYLGKRNKELSLRARVRQLLHIAQGLKDIHAKNLVHRDFHSGNILKGIEKTSCLITDLGLCKPVNEINKEEKIFGVMPYVAPEVLRSQPYTQKADIYSFGIIAYEVLSGFSPYYDREHDEFLGMQICQGLRPQFQIRIPKLLEGLIKGCWDSDPNQRPTIQELEKTLRNWQRELEESSMAWNPKDTEFTQQLQEAEEYNKILSEEIKFPKYKIHYGAIYTSRCLPTKEITQLLQKSQTSEQQATYSQSLIIDPNEFKSLEIKEENQTSEPEQVAQILHQPFGIPSSSKPK